ncbi:excinuclease ABC subunit UvrA, partial [Candidatus Dojkabacteria bacterium]|nr:excinuclease ABC subunit UvrA [Candidatus Dojkabacteria bacterium]
HGKKNKKYTVNYYSKARGSRNTIKVEFEGLVSSLMRRYKETDSDYIRREIEQYMREIVCPSCEGARLRPEALAVTIEKQNIKEITDLALNKVTPWLKKLKEDSKEERNDDSLTDQEREIVRQVVKEIETRIQFLLAVGLDYLTLNRTARTLSGGESQRIRLASQIGTGLSGVLYVLDEPSIGLHQRDNQRLIETLINLKKLGNSILVVEHDEDTMRQADYLIDMGPGAGMKGGEVIAQGTPQEVMNDEKSVTGKYLSGKTEISAQEIRKISKKIVQEQISKQGQWGSTTPIDSKLEIIGAVHNNLKELNVEIPLGQFVSITGVSGSGKSSLINETLSKALKKHFYNAKAEPGIHKEIKGLDNIDKVIDIDQSPIGRTPRSNPVTYTGVFTQIRELFASTRESQSRGYKPGRFSFNVRGGRCETCQGDGLIKIEMQFLPDVYVQCEVCKGKRYNRETLQIDYNGMNISEILEMSVDDALEFFENIPNIHTKLETLKQVGLGYIKLGQSATTLSGGEAQRIKLASELSKRSTGKTLYILDEPTTGLHFEDLKKLLIVLHSLVEKGNSVVVIEHNLDLIKTSDWIIDLGPEGGEKGGTIIAEGTPEQVANTAKSYTGQWLKKIGVN